MKYLSSITNKISRYKRNHRTRAQLKELSSHLLRDIGLSDDDVEREIRKSFYKD